MWKKYVALGDSMTEGYGDEVEGIVKKDWPSYVAEHFQISDFHNIGKSGLRSDQVYETQFQKAVEMKPDLVSVMAGANDFMQQKWNPKTYRAHMEEMITTFTKAGATVITANYPDFTKYVAIPMFIKPIVKKQLKTCNAILDELAEKYNTVHLDVWNNPLADQRENWSKDNVHPNALGYKKISEVVIEQLSNIEKVGAK
ncbi:MAG: SGNH/GDSL hydrolase family protein [Bacillaceae bacterium]